MCLLAFFLFSCSKSQTDVLSNVCQPCSRSDQLPGSWSYISNDGLAKVHQQYIHMLVSSTPLLCIKKKKHFEQPLGVIIFYKEITGVSK